MTIIRPLAGLTTCLVAATFVAAQGDQDALIAKRDKKLQSEFLSFAAWTTDYDVARETAKETGKPIFAYFTRSYSP